MNRDLNLPSRYQVVPDSDYFGHDHVLILVQGNLVVGSFPGHQWLTAVDLARVLCRALAQTFDIFQNCEVCALDVRVGMQVRPDAASWIHLAQARPTRRAQVEVEIFDASHWPSGEG